MAILIPSPKEYRILREKQLDQEFHERYPAGMFTLQRWIWHMFQGERSPALNMYWRAHRRGGCRTWGEDCSPCFEHIPQAFVGVTSLAGGIGEVSYQNNSFGKCTHYKTLDKMLVAAKRFDFPTKATTRFTTLYKLKAGL